MSSTGAYIAGMVGIIGVMLALFYNRDKFYNEGIPWVLEGVLLIALLFVFSDWRVNINHGTPSGSIRSFYNSDRDHVTSSPEYYIPDTTPSPLPTKETPLPPTTMSLLDMEYLAKNATWISKNAQDNLANFYKKCIWGYDGNWIVYKLGGGYKSLSGTVFLDYDARSTESIQHIEIYGDTDLLFTSIDFTAMVEPESFDIDVSGVNQLKFLFVVTKPKRYDIFSVDSTNYARVGDLTLQP